VAQSYQQTIELLVRGQNKLRAVTDELKAANRELNTLETKTKAIKFSEERAKNVLRGVGRDIPRTSTGKFAKDPNRKQRQQALRDERTAERRLRLNQAREALQQRGVQRLQSQQATQNRILQISQKQLLNQTKLNAANDLYGRRLQEFARAGGNTNTELKQRVDQIRQAFEVSTQGGTENLQQIQAFNTELGRIVERQRELNRLRNLKPKGFEQARRLQERIDVVENLGGATPKQIKSARTRAAGVIAAADVGNADLYTRAVENAVAGVTRLERESKKTRTEMSRSQKVTLSWNIALEQLNEIQQDIKRTQLSKELKAQNRELQKFKGGVDKRTPQAFNFRGTSRDKRKPFTQSRLGRVAIGAAFPSLFGAGLGGIVGGGLGELAGPLGGVVGSAIGSALDEAAKSVVAFGDALRKPTQNLEKLAQAAGLAGTPSAANIQIAQFLGAPEVSGTIAKAGVTEVIGEKGVANLEKLSENSQDLGNNFSKLGTRISAAFAPAITAVTRFTNALFFGSQGANETPEQRLQQQRQVLSGLETAVRTGQTADGRVLTPTNIGALNLQIKVTREQIAKLEQQTKNIADGNNQQKEAQQDINNLVKAQLAPLKAATKFEQNRLTLRRDTLASQQAELQIAQIQSTLDQQTIRNKNLQAGVEKQILELQMQQTEEQLKQAEAAQLNAIKLAKIQIQRDISGEIQKEGTALNSNLDVVRQMEEVTLSDAINYSKKQEAVKRQLDFQVKLKLEQMKMRLLTVNEQELKEQILRTTAQEINLLRSKALLQEEQIRQNEVMRRDAIKAKSDARELSNLQKELNARMQISQMDPGRAFKADGIGVGFFGESVLLEANLIQERTVQLELYNEEIANLQSRLNDLKSLSVDIDKQNKLKEQLDDLKNARDSYEKLQPAIDQARVRQQQFNDAFALASPIVASFIDGISEVVQGTKSAQEAFADFLRTIGDTLVQEGTRMIATYIAIGIAKAFAGLSGGGSAPDPFSSNVSSALPNTSSLADSAAAGTFSFSSPRANGGPVQGGQPYMVGERGPELFVPSSNGGVMRNEDMRQLMGRSPASNVPAMNFTFETTNIGGQEFVSREQLEVAMQTTRRQAANDGAKRGMNMTLDRMQNSPRTRARVGIS
jgi:hypothetical protein